MHFIVVVFEQNVDVWSKWNFSHACNLHGIQSRIARRAAELLQPGGLMVYSTCSLNPVENEAVVYTLLLKFAGQLELVEARDKLPGLVTRRGLHTWNLMGKTGTLYANMDEVTRDRAENLIRPYMFPPEASVAADLHLERCIRVMPHDQNTGGFFIALIRKIATPALGEASSSESVDASVNKPPTESNRVMKAPPAKRVRHVYDENPFRFMDDEDEEQKAAVQDWPRIKKFFGIADSFPSAQMMTRNKRGECVRNVYFVSESIRSLATNNADRVKFINMGVPLFAKAEIKDESQVAVRICQVQLLCLIILHFYDFLKFCCSR